MAGTITTLTGLQNLRNLERIDVDFNSLVSIDLSGLPNLTNVDVSDQNSVEDNSNCLTTINLAGSTAIEQLRLDDNDFSGGLPNLSALTSLYYLDLDQCDISGNVNLSTLTSLITADLSGNSGITSVQLPVAPTNNLNVNGAALTETAVNNILQWLDGNELVDGYVNVAGGTNAIPTGNGATAKTNLINKNWDVYVNTAPPGYVGIAASTDFDIVGDFTIEMFVNMNSADGYPRPYSFGAYPAPNAMSIEGTTLYFWANESVGMSGTFDPTLNQWYHIAAMGSGSTGYLFVNGTQIGTSTFEGGINISSQTLPLTIGYGNEPNSGFNGKMSNFRWSNAAMYPTTGFTVPTTPLTSTADTVLMTFQGTDLTAQLLDNSGNGHNATASGATYSVLNPFTGVSGSLQMGNV